VLFNPVLAGLTVRQALAKRRWIIVLLLAALPVVMATLIHLYGTADDEPLQIVAIPIMTLIYTVIVPVIALVLASSSFGAEIEDGTVIYLLAKPISRAEIVITKLVVTAMICIALGAVSTLGAGMSLVRGLDPTRLVFGLTAGAALGALLYTVLFLALGLVTKRGMLVGLTYLIVWEGALGSFFQGTRVLSVRQYMLAVADAISTVPPDIFVAQLTPKTAYLMSAIVAVGVVTLCITKLRKFEIGQAA
jgi:ABC-2 type transport system permease protein